MKNFVTFLLLLSIHALAFCERDKFILLSPDKKTEVTIDLKGKIFLTVTHGGIELIQPSPLTMSLDQGRNPGFSPVLKKKETRQVTATIVAVVPEKRKFVPDHFNELILYFKGDYGIKVRAYNDGVAYRFFTSFTDNITVVNEELAISLSEKDSVWFGREKSFLSHSEREYKLMAVTAIDDTMMCCLPAVVAKPNGWKVAISESDLLDYPGMYLHGGPVKATLSAKFPPYPLNESPVGDRTLKVTKTADYIAVTKGTREFPWRVFGIAEQDGQLVNNDIVFRLGSPLKLTDISWIRPGKVSWDWWNANNIHGVSFQSGINTETYKYYIDFASKYGLEYVILDEGWSAPSDLFRINPEMNMEELFTYAEQKKVGIILWVLFNALDQRMGEALDQFQRWGAKGIKVDFMQRDDQQMVNFYEKVAVECARRKLLVDFHGSFKPTGLNRTYPNVLTREGVRGLEHSKWSENITPKHDVTLPFTRMFAGAMDYTPGAMCNAAKDSFMPRFNQPMSQGTRCHQLAMYVVYESPLQMLCDSPSNYMKEPEIMQFLSGVPSTWDETLVLDGKIGDYITVVRYKGDDIYIGSMTNWTPRDVAVELSFLKAGEYEALIYSDGTNANRYGSDYKMKKAIVDASKKLNIHLAPGGGWVARLRKVTRE